MPNIIKKGEFIMKKTVKKLCVLLAVIISLSALTACNNTKKTSKTEIDLSNEAVITGNDLPISEEGITLTLWTPNSSQGYVKSYNDFEAFKEIAKRTGVTIDFVHPTGTAREQFNIMMASGDATDLIYYYIGDLEGKKLVQEGSVHGLSKYIEKWAPNFRTLLEENPSVAKQMRNKSDDIFMFPKIIDDEKFLAYDGFFIRKDWLDAVGLDVPKTIEDWEKVLTAFRDNDLNGNGKKDEVPFSTTVSGLMYEDAFASAFGMPSYGYYIDPETGKITHSILQPELKDFFATISRWYKEGLINPNYITATTDELDALMLNNQLGAVYIDNNNSLPKYMLNNPDAELVAVPYPVDKNGKSYHPNSGTTSTVTTEGALVTSSCKNVKEAVRFLDYLYSKEASDLIYWGIEGESYTVDEQGNYKYTDAILKNPDGKTPYEAICKYMTNTGFAGMHQYKSMLGLETSLTDKVRKVKNDSVNYSLQTDKSASLLSLPTTLDEDKEIQKIDGDLTTYLSEIFPKFLLGIEPISNFDACAEQAKKLGINDRIAIMQKAYDRAN